MCKIEKCLVKVIRKTRPILHLIKRLKSILKKHKKLLKEHKIWPIRHIRIEILARPNSKSIYHKR